jgi:opacity protein-like surface antigen
VGPEPAAAQKQSPFFVAVSWDINVPVGSTTDFVKKVDPAGLGIEGRYRGILPVGPGSFGAGFQVAWHSMEEKTDESIVRGRATITGTQVRELSTTPILAKLTYTFDHHKKLHPYLGFGLGAARVLRRLDLGIKLNYFASTNDVPQQLYMNLCLGVGFN